MSKNFEIIIILIQGTVGTCCIHIECGTIGTRAHIRFRIVVHADDKVVCAVIGKRRVKGDGGPPRSVESDFAAEHFVAGRQAYPIRITRESGLGSVYHIEVKGACGRFGVRNLESDGRDGASLAYFTCSINLFR